MEAIKLFLFVDSTAFVISADERLIKYAVRRRFPEIPGDAAEIGRDYLEKLIQFPVRIPPLSSNEIETYINLLFSSKHLDIDNFNKIRTMVFEKNRASFDSGSYDYEEAKRILIDPHDELEGWLHLSRQITPVLTIGLSGNPRQCKRFLNMLLMRIKMAKSRGIDLKQRVMAKLMLLEYFKGESFRLLSETQAHENGKLGFLKVFEQNINEKVESDDSEEESPQLPKEFEVWLNDPWLKNWLKSEPILASEDLRPYFYFSRDKLNPLNIVSQRITPKAQATLDKLLNKSEAIVNIGIREFESLGPADVSGIFEVIGEKSKQDEESDGSLKLLSQLCQKRMELTSQLIIILNSISPTAIKPAIIAQTKKLSELPEYKGAFNNLLTLWSNSTNVSLSKIAKSTLAKR